MAFSPVDLDSLQLWLDASQLTGLSDGDPMSVWPDLSPNAVSLTDQGDATTDPTYGANALNGLPGVVFSPTGDVAPGLQSNAGDTDNLLTPGAYTVFVVLQNASTDEYLDSELWGASQSYSQLCPFLIQDPTSFSAFGIQTGFGTCPQAAIVGFGPGYSENGPGLGLSYTGGVDIVAFTFDGSKELNLWRNGVLVGSDSRAPDPLPGPGDGAYIVMGGQQSYIFFGVLGEVIACNAVLDPDTFSDVTAYLMNKWVNPVPSPSGVQWLEGTSGAPGGGGQSSGVAR